jgi:hypothetical protein
LTPPRTHGVADIAPWAAYDFPNWDIISDRLDARLSGNELHAMRIIESSVPAKERVDSCLTAAPHWKV